jgi:hypothetical protein
MKEGWPVLNDLGDWVCEHGTAVDVHCCHCHSGFIFDPEHECPDVEADMDTRTGDIYDNRELAKAAGVPDDDLVTGSREALEKLKTRLVFTKGSFKPVPALAKRED